MLYLALFPRKLELQIGAIAETCLSTTFGNKGGDGAGTGWHLTSLVHCQVRLCRNAPHHGIAAPAPRPTRRPAALECSPSFVLR